MWSSFQGRTLNVLLRDPLERIFSFFLSLSAIPRELIQHSDFYTTFDFFPLCSAWHTPPPLGDLRRIRVFIAWRRLLLRRTSHPSGSRLLDASLPSQTSAPGTIRAPENPRFPAASKRIHLTDDMAPSRVQRVKGSRQRRHETPPSGGRLYGTG